MTDPSRDTTVLRHALAELAKARVVPRIAALLDQRRAEVRRLLGRAVIEEVAAYSASGNPDILPELDRHASDNIDEICRLLRGEPLGRFDFITAQAHRRAEQRFPLEATLHAYRCGHRVVSHWIRDAVVALRPRALDRAVSAVADFAIEYTNAISTLATAEYVAHTRALAEAEGDRRTELLDLLARGYDESDGRVARVLRRAGYLEQRLHFCVAVAQSTDPLEMENLARAHRIVEAMTDAVASKSIRALVGVRNDVVTAVFSKIRRVSGWTAPRADLADDLCASLLVLGPSVLVGLSNDHPSTSFIPRALHEATVALDFASVTDRVVRFSGLPIRRLLLHRGADYVHAALPRWSVAFEKADVRIGGALVSTLRTYADADMNVLQAARALNVHPNTIYARMQRIKELTGLDCQRYHHLTELLLAADCRRR